MDTAWLSFVAWSVQFLGIHPEQFEKSCERMSELLAGYLEFAYSRGKPFSQGKMAVLAVQDKYRTMRKRLQKAWDALGTWEIELPLTMHTPLPPTLMWSLFAVGATMGLAAKGASCTEVAGLRDKLVMYVLGPHEARGVL